MTDPGSSAEPQAGSAVSNLVNTLVAPREAFASLSRKATFVLAMLVCMLGPIALSVVVTPRLDMDKVVRQKIEESGRSLTQEQIDQQVEIANKFKWLGTVVQVVIQPIFLLLVGAIFLAAFRLLGSEIDFRQSMAVLTHGLLPTFALASLIGIIVIYARGGELSVEAIQSGTFIASNLGVFAAEGTSKVTRALLTSVDVFSAWSVFLLAMGYRIVGRLKSGAAWGGVLTIWCLGILIKVGLAAIF